MEEFLKYPEDFLKSPEEFLISSEEFFTSPKEFLTFPLEFCDFLEDLSFLGKLSLLLDEFIELFSFLLDELRLSTPFDFEKF